MNRYITLSALVAGSLALLASCAQEIDGGQTSVQSGKNVITVAFPENLDSKVDVSEISDGSGLELNWEDSDYLTITGYGASDEIVVETYTLESIDGKIARFTGNAIEGCQSYDILLSRSGDLATRSYTSQTQATVSSTDHLVYDACLTGVDSYQAVTFTDTWAEAHGGSLVENGCLLLYFQMPDDAGKLQSITLTAPQAIFYTTNAADATSNSLTLALSDADMDSDNFVKAHIMTSVQETQIPAGAELTLTVVSNIGTWSKKFTPGASLIETGKRNVIKLNSSNWTVPTGDGTSASSPYILRTVSDLTSMKSKMSSNKTYFALVNDIDMESITEWIEIKDDTPIDFNGNDRTLDNFTCTTGAYRGFIRILNGIVYNLSITNANVDGTANEGTQPCGILAGYCGNNGASATGVVTDVHVQGIVNGAASTGGLIGVIGNGQVLRCSADVNVTTSARRSGGLVGSFYDNNDNCRCTISDCWTAGTFTSTNQNSGGIIGELHQGNKVVNVASVTNCYSTMAVKADRNVGGVVGFMVNSNKFSKVTGCIAWNSSISTTGSKKSFYSSGVVIGYTKNRHEVADNFRKSDIVYDVKYLDLDNQAAPVFDCRNFSDANPFVWTGLQDPWGTHYQPYHGIAAASGATASSVAKSLGWDETIWDLSGDLPTLRR